MKNYLAALSATALMSFAPFALAASSTDLTVTGFITPSACTPSLSDGGMIDFDKIPAKDLNSDRYTEIGRPGIQLTVACNSATSIALDLTDNRLGTAYEEGIGYGLGLTATDEKIGAASLHIVGLQSDGHPAQAIESIDGGTSWMRTTMLHEDALITVSAVGTTLPIPATNILMDLEIRTRIAPANGLTLTSEVEIDGSVTIDVKYL